MKDFEYEEQQKLPEKYRPLTAWIYFGLTILYSIPLVGFIFLIIHSLSDANINRRSFARSFFCVLIISLVITIIYIVLILLGVISSSIIDSI